MDQQIYGVLLAPRVTEKSTLLGELNNQFVFKVAPDATKPQVKKAVEELFKVKVKSVQVLNLYESKTRISSFRYRSGKLCLSGGRLNAYGGSWPYGSTGYTRAQKNSKSCS